MTPQEAMKLINDMEFAEKYQGKQEYADMLLLCKKSLENQIPKKTIEKAHEGFNFELSHYLACPSCDQAIVNVRSKAEYKPKFCHYCGQALDWSE